MAKATLGRSLWIKNKLGDKSFHYSDGTVIPNDTAMGIFWNYGKLTDYANGNPENSNKGAANRAKTYEKKRLIK
jgi:hypothetical protein